MAINLEKLKAEAENLVTTFPQREALLRKAVAQFEQGLQLIAQAGYSAKEMLEAEPAPPQPEPLAPPIGYSLKAEMPEEAPPPPLAPEPPYPNLPTPNVSGD